MVGLCQTATQGTKLADLKQRLENAKRMYIIHLLEKVEGGGILSVHEYDRLNTEFNSIEYSERISKTRI